MDRLSQGLKIPPGPLGTTPESTRPVQVQEQVANRTPVYTLNRPITMILGQFRRLRGDLIATCSCSLRTSCTDLALSGLVPCGPGGIFKPCNKRSKGMTHPTLAPCTSLHLLAPPCTSLHLLAPPCTSSALGISIISILGILAPGMGKLRRSTTLATTPSLRAGRWGAGGGR